MRSKKTILLVDGDDLRHSARRFILETRGFAVVSASSTATAVGIIAACAPFALNLVLISSSSYVPGAVISLAKSLNPEVRALEILDRPKPDASPTLADLARTWFPSETAEVTSAIRILVARKRGPKKRPIPIPTPTPTETRSAA